MELQFILYAEYIRERKRERDIYGRNYRQNFQIYNLASCNSIAMQRNAIPRITYADVVVHSFKKKKKERVERKKKLRSFRFCRVAAENAKYAKGEEKEG